MMLRIKNLRAKTLIGVYAEERVAKRELILNITAEYDHAQAVLSDNVAHVPDYAVIEQRIVSALDQQSFQLLESLAVHVAALVLAFEQVTAVTVEIDKPGVLSYSDSVSVSYSQTR